jgi:F-type H+-transporting ATPase subunit delta
MAELATIARPYAEALFQSSGADLSGTGAWLDALSAVAAQPEMQQYAGNPNVSQSQVFDLLTSVAKVNLGTQGQNFLRTVIDNRRTNALPEIAAQFRLLKNKQNGTADAVVYSAFPMDGAALADTSALLEKRFGRKLNVSVHIDTNLIGGIRAVVGDEVLDTSVKARLEQMKVALTA